jgi:hypothetical protein
MLISIIVSLPRLGRAEVSALLLNSVAPLIVSFFIFGLRQSSKAPPIRIPGLCRRRPLAYLAHGQLQRALGRSPLDNNGTLIRLTEL